MKLNISFSDSNLTLILRNVFGKLSSDFTVVCLNNCVLLIQVGLQKHLQVRVFVDNVAVECHVLTAVKEPTIGQEFATVLVPNGVHLRLLKIFQSAQRLLGFQRSSAGLEQLANHLLMVGCNVATVNQKAKVFRRQAICLVFQWFE